MLSCHSSPRKPLVEDDPKRTPSFIQPFIAGTANHPPPPGPPVCPWQPARRRAATTRASFARRRKTVARARRCEGSAGKDARGGESFTVCLRYSCVTVETKQERRTSQTPFSTGTHFYLVSGKRIKTFFSRKTGQDFKLVGLRETVVTIYHTDIFLFGG